MNSRYITYFEIEKVVITAGAKELMIKENFKTSDLLLLLERHKFNDDDNESEEDKRANKQATITGGMFLSVYKHLSKKLYIISYLEPGTERAEYTNILLANEY